MEREGEEIERRKISVVVSITSPNVSRVSISLYYMYFEALRGSSTSDLNRETFVCSVPFPNRFGSTRPRIVSHGANIIFSP